MQVVCLSPGNMSYCLSYEIGKRSALNDLNHEVGTCDPSDLPDVRKIVDLE